MAILKTLTVNGVTYKVASPVPVVDITLPASAWTGVGKLHSQVVSIPGVTANSQINLTPTVEQIAIFYEKDITFHTENDGGIVTVYVVGQKPANDYTIPVKIVEVEHSGGKIYGIPVATPINPDKIGGAGVYMGPDVPTDENVKIWIKTDSQDDVIENALPLAINADGTPFEGDENGLAAGGLSANGAVSEDAEMYYSGFVPVTPTSKLYFSGMEWDTMEYGFFLYDRTFKYIGGWHIFDYLPDFGEDYVEGAVETDGDALVWVDFSKLFSASYGGVTPEELAKTAYIRLQGIVEITGECVVRVEGYEVDTSNALNYAVNEDGTPFIGTNGEVGYTHGFFETEDGSLVEDDYYYASGYIPVTSKSKVRFNNIEFDDMMTCFVLYDSNFNMIAAEDPFGSSLLGTEIVEDEDGKYRFLSIDFASFANIAYFRFDMYGIYNNSSVFVDTLMAPGGESVLKIRNADGSFKKVEPELQSETWTFELEDGTTVTKQVVVK